MAGAHVAAEGASSRNGETDTNGVVTFRTLTPGAYRLHAEGDAMVPLEKEITIRAGAPATTEMALSAAPPPPKPEPVEAPAPPPPPPPPPASQTPALGTPGEPRVLSLLDLAERSLGGKEAVKAVSIGCSGLGTAQLVVVKEAIPSQANQDADLMMYLVAGTATLNMNHKDQPLTPGWFSIVPRGTSYTVEKKGRNPAILLSVSSGPPCAGGEGSSK